MLFECLTENIFLKAAMIFTRIERKKIERYLLYDIYTGILTFLFFHLSNEDEFLVICQDRQEVFRWTLTRQERPNQIYQAEGIF